MSSLRNKWLVENIGTIQYVGDVTKFEIKIPGHAKRIVGVFLFSNNSALQEAYTQVELSLNINNGAQNILKKPFVLNQILSTSFKPMRLCYLNEPITAGQLISGYIKCLHETVEDPPAYVISVKLYIKYLTE